MAQGYRRGILREHCAIPSISGSNGPRIEIRQDRSWLAAALDVVRDAARHENECSDRASSPRPHQDAYRPFVDLKELILVRRLQVRARDVRLERPLAGQVAVRVRFKQAGDAPIGYDRSPPGYINDAIGDLGTPIPPWLLPAPIANLRIFFLLCANQLLERERQKERDAVSRRRKGQ